MNITFFMIMNSLSILLNIRVMSFEYEVISLFFDKDSITTTEMLRKVGASTGTLFSIIGRLEGRNVLCSSVDECDRRKKLYRLCDETKWLIRAVWDNNISPEFLANKSKGFGPIKYLNAIRRTYNDVLKVDHLSCEFTILIYLYNEDGMTRTELSNLIAVSSTRLGYALRKLRDLGHITTNPTTRDGRQRPYYLSDPARKIIDDSSVQIRTWLDSGPTITRYSLRHPIEPASHATDSM